MSLVGYYYKGERRRTERLVIPCCGIYSPMNPEPEGLMDVRCLMSQG